MMEIMSMLYLSAFIDVTGHTLVKAKNPQVRAPRNPSAPPISTLPILPLPLPLPSIP